MRTRATLHLNRDDLRLLQDAGWNGYVGDKRGLWVRVAQQRTLMIRADTVLRSYPCSTAAAGVGNDFGSYRTPLGWHEVGEKIGHGLIRGQV